MGFNTVVLVLNDDLGSIKKNAQEFCAKLCLMAGGGGSNGPHPRDFFHQHGIVTTHHADGTAVILAGGNTATVVGYYRGYRHNETHSQVRILEEMLDKYGLGTRRLSLYKLQQKLKWAKRDLEQVRGQDPLKRKSQVPYDEHMNWRHKVEQAEGLVDWLANQVDAAKKAKKAKKEREKCPDTE